MKRSIDFFKLEWNSLPLAKRKALVLEYGLGAESRYGDTFWTEAVSDSSGKGLTLAKWLVTQGQAIDARTRRGTALHVAATNGNVAGARWLVASGANVNAKVDGATPLEAMLESVSNDELEHAALIAKMLSRAGANLTPKARTAALRAYTEFDYYRDAMSPGFRKRCAAAARSLCRLLRVTPPKPRNQHDRKSKIIVPKGSLAKQFEAMWNFLVPAQGQAATLQGEVIRVAGRINDELLRNGGVNWDLEYRKMAKAFATYVKRGAPVDDVNIEAAAAYAKAVDQRRPKQDDAHVLAAIAVAWVRKNPRPIPRGRVAYHR